jgi:membrane protease YdiL (CAAX protease family)
LDTEEKQKNDFNIPLNRLIFFFILNLIYIAIINFTDSAEEYQTILLFDAIFIVFVLSFYIVDFKQITILFRWPEKNFKLWLSIILGMPVFAFVIVNFTDFINQSLFGISPPSYYELFIDSPYPLLLTLVSFAFVPAIFEEIAFRAFAFNQLQQVSSTKIAIIVSAIMFTILHLSIISFLWIFPIGLLFGYWRAKHKTLWYGILAHFIYNASVCLFEYLYY